MKCKICKNNSEKLFEKVILQKYKTNYYKCTNCSFMHTDEPFWLSEAYTSAITSLDIGLLGRNNLLKKDISMVIDCCFPDAKNFLDYAGGYGAFTRLMRDAGYNYYNQDDYCENIFAKHFDIKDSNIEKFDVVTGFEVLEHFNNPLEEIKAVFEYADNAIFSTELVSENISDIENWWYLTEETGQHIAFYTIDSMKCIAKLFNKNYYCRNSNIHVFTANKLKDYQIDYAIKDIKKKKYFLGLYKKRFNYSISRISLQQHDYNLIKEMLKLKK